MPGLLTGTGRAPGARQVATLKKGKRDRNGVKESPEQVTAPVAFSSKPGKAAMLAYITPEEAELLRSMGQGYSTHGSGEMVAPGKRQHIGPRGLLSFNGNGGAAPGKDKDRDDTGTMGADRESDTGRSEFDGIVSDIKENSGFISASLGANSESDTGRSEFHALLSDILGKDIGDIPTPGGNPPAGASRNTSDTDERGFDQIVGDFMANAMGANGFAGSGRGFGGLGFMPGVISSIGEMAGELARDAGLKVATPAPFALDDPTTKRYEGNNPDDFYAAIRRNDRDNDSEHHSVARRLIRKGPIKAAQDEAAALAAQNQDLASNNHRAPRGLLTQAATAPNGNGLPQVYQKYGLPIKGSTDAAKRAAQELQSRGRDGDTVLAHISEQEAAELAARGGRGTINPHTGLLEFARRDNFDPDLYLKSRPDVKAAIDKGHFTDPWHHYTAYGQAEGTPGNAQEARMKDSFDRDVYLDNRPDVKAAIGDGHFTNAWHHYAAFGQYEGTPANADQEAARRPIETRSNSDRGLVSANRPSASYGSSSTASNLNDILASNSPLMQRAAAQGRMLANRRGLMNSSMTAEAAQSAMIDAALPVASQDASQNFNAALQQNDIDHQRWLANLDASTRTSIAGLNDATRREIANLQVSAKDRDNIAAMVTAAQQIYSNEWSTVINNSNIPAYEREKYFVHLQKMLSQQITLIEGMYGVNLDWAEAL